MWTCGVAWTRLCLFARTAVLGSYSGTEIPRPIRSSGNSMHVVFHTDAGNYGLQTAGVSDDPGFYVSSATAPF